MGRLTAMALKDELPLADAVRIHLTSNHYPPVPVSMVPTCLKAIRFAKGGNLTHKIILPKGVTFRGHRMAPVCAIVEQHHLDTFIDE